MSKKLVLLTCIIAIVSSITTPAVFADIAIVASESCRTQQSAPDTNVYNSSSLTVRQLTDDPVRTLKSWIKFDISELDIDRLATATLTFTLAQDRGTSNDVQLSCVNDDCLDNINWVSNRLTWNNAPGNNTDHIGDLDTSKTTLLGRIPLGNGLAGDTYTIAILEILKSDTDGIVQFVLHNSSAYTNFAGHEHAEEAWRPFIEAKVHPRHTAIKPYPAITETDAYQKPMLSWTPGPYVEGLSPQHQIFFSDSFNDVNEGVGGVTQDANEYPAPGSPLDFGKTYYWRVDEANSVSGWDQGVVWSFTVEPEGYALPQKHITATASSNDKDAINTINGSGLNADDLHSSYTTTMWLSDRSAPGAEWIHYEFDKPIKLHQMLVWNYNGSGSRKGYGLKNVTIEHSLDGLNWVALDHVPVFNQAPGWSGYASDIAVDFNNLMIKQVKITAQSNWGTSTQYGLSEVRFLVLPLAPREMNPAEGSTEVDLAVTLSWRSGREVETHAVYFGSDPNNLPLAEVVTGVPYATYDTADQKLQLGQTYYWQVNEVNEAEVPSVWASEVLSFTAISFLVVDNMDSYPVIDFDAENEDEAIWNTWIDGFADPTNNGALVGGETGYPETSIVHEGRQSLSIYYSNNTAGKSEATAQVADLPSGIGSDWTRDGIQTLELYFYGAEGNTGQFYVKVNGIKKVYDGDPGAISNPAWQPFSIDLASLNTTLDNIKTLTVGVEGAGSGVVYIDAIRLF